MAARTHTGPAQGFARGLAQRLTFLPDPVRDFLRRRTFELAGLGLIAMAVIGALALASYDSLDASLNNATGQSASNLMGTAGATLADLSLQAFGLVAALPVLVFIAWGTRLVRHLNVRRFGWRLLCLLLAMCTAAFALQYAPVPDGWPLRSGLGGTFRCRLRTGRRRARRMGRPEFAVALAAAPSPPCSCLSPSACHARTGGAWDAVRPVVCVSAPRARAGPPGMAPKPPAAAPAACGG